jgi:protein-tyrosine-phosphatase
MAEGLMKQLCGLHPYVQSAGLKSDLDVDGFAIAVCAELGVELDRHRTRSLIELEKGGEALSRFDLVVALSEASAEAARREAAHHGLSVEYWPISDPTSAEGPREARLERYRQTRDEILARLKARWGGAR